MDAAGWEGSIAEGRLTLIYMMFAALKARPSTPLPCLNIPVSSDCLVAASKMPVVLAARRCLGTP